MFKLRTWNILFAVATAFAQSPPAPSFEVAAIKPHGPLTAGTTMEESDRFIVYRGINLRRLLIQAYGVPAPRIVAPSWITDDFFDVSATLPEGTTKASIPAMLRQLLVSRFGLQTHLELREVPVYAITIGKDGPKLQQCDVPEGADKPRSPQQLLQGLPDSPSRVCPQGRSVLRQATSILVETDTIGDLAVRLSRATDRPVVDRTGLGGHYWIAVEAEQLRDAPSTDASGLPPLPVELQRLGLKLEPSDERQQFLVIDKLNRTPTDN